MKNTFAQPKRRKEGSRSKGETNRKYKMSGDVSSSIVA